MLNLLQSSRLFNFNVKILINKLINGEISASSPRHEYVILNLHGKFLRPKKIDSIFDHLEHLPENFAIGVIGYILAELLINNIAFTFGRLFSLYHFLHGESWFRFLLGKLGQLKFGILQLFKQLERYLVGLKDFLFHCDDVFCTFVEIICDFGFGVHCLLKIYLQLVILVNQKICLLVLGSLGVLQTTDELLHVLSVLFIFLSFVFESVDLSLHLSSDRLEVVKIFILLSDDAFSEFTYASELVDALAKHKVLLAKVLGNTGFVVQGNTGRFQAFDFDILVLLKDIFSNHL